MARRTALMRLSGPYRVVSRADGTLDVTPKWGQFPEYTAEDGGGPGLFTRSALAGELQAFLNAVYPAAERPPGQWGRSVPEVTDGVRTADA